MRDVAFSHGWLQLPPYRWDEEAGTLTRLERLPSGRTVSVAMRQEGEALAVTTEAPPGELPHVVALCRWVLALDDDLAGFHALCRDDPWLRGVLERGRGRILRCPTVWEDVVKTLFSVNTMWRQTIGMTRRLVENYGDAHPDGERAFPPPERVAALEVEEVRARCRAGYRSAFLLRIAREVAEGRADLEALKDPALPTAEVERRLRLLPGIGPYAAANVLLLLGRCDHLPVDTWFRRVVRAAWFPGQEPSDREMVAAFERYRPYRTLVYFFYDWERAAGAVSL